MEITGDTVKLTTLKTIWVNSNVAGMEGVLYDYNTKYGKNDIGSYGRSETKNY